jgi:hypothetical protein
MYNQNRPIDPKNFVKLIIIIHLALFMGQTLFAAVVLFISKDPALNLKPGNDVLFYVVPFMLVFGIFAGSFVFKQLTAKLAEKTSLTEKLQAYQTALIIRYALSEGASMFSIVCLLLTNNVYYLILAGINILYFIIIRPTKLKILDDLNLNYEEQTEMDTNQAFK